MTFGKQVLDMGPDEDAALLKKRSVQHWDAKKKKFIQVQSSELRNKDVSSKRRSESGGKIGKKGPTGLYVPRTSFGNDDCVLRD